MQKGVLLPIGLPIIELMEVYVVRSTPCIGK